MNSRSRPGSSLRNSATDTATIRTPNTATTAKSTTRQSAWRHPTMTAKLPNIANTISSSSWPDGVGDVHLGLDADPPRRVGERQAACERGDDAASVQPLAELQHARDHGGRPRDRVVALGGAAAAGWFLVRDRRRD